MKNVELMVARGGRIPLTPQQLEAIAIVRELAIERQRHVICRLKPRGPFGVLRPSFAVRLQHVLPWLKWLLEEVAADVDALVPTIEAVDE